MNKNKYKKKILYIYKTDKTGKAVDQRSAVDLTGGRNLLTGGGDNKPQRAHNTRQGSRKFDWEPQAGAVDLTGGRNSLTGGGDNKSTACTKHETRGAVDCETSEPKQGEP